MAESIFIAQPGSGGGGEANTASSAGGISLVLAKNVFDLPFKGLVAGTSVSITEQATTLTIVNDDPGEFNAAASLGAGSPVLVAAGPGTLTFRGITVTGGLGVSTNATDLILDGSGLAATLQSAYDLGNTIAATAARDIAFSNAVDLTDLLDLTRTFAGAGNALDVNMGPGNEAVTGDGINISSGTGATGNMLSVNNLGSGDALNVQDGGTTVLQVTGAGAVNIDPTTGEDLTFTTLVAGDIVLNGLSVSSAGDLDMGTGDITNAGAITSTGFSGPVNGVTLSTAAGSANFLDGDGNYTAPGGSVTLQSAYDAGNTVAATAARDIAFSNAVDLTDLMTLTRTFVGAGNALDVNMGPGNEAVTGDGINITSGTGATGNMLFVNNLGSGDALNVQDGDTTVLQVTGAGAVNIDPTTGEDLTFTTLVAGDIVLNGLSVSSAGDLDMGTGDITNAGAIASTGFSGPLSGNVTGDVTGDVNSVTLTAGGAGGTLYLDDSGAYTAPPGGGGGNSLQQAYVAGNTITVTTAEGAVAMSNAADVTNVLDLTRTFVGAGNALDVNMGPGSEAVTGDGINITSGTGATGRMLFVNNLGSGDALNVQDGGTTVLQVTGAGAVNIDPTTGQDLTFTTLVAGDIVFNSVVIDSAGDLDMGTGDITNAGAITATSFSGPVNGVTLTTGGVATDFLNATGAYTAPAGTATLQTAYDLGNTVVATAARAIAFSNAGDLTDLLTLTRTFVGAGNSLDVNMGPGNEAVTGDGINITSGTGATGNMLFVNNLGSGDALNVQDGGTTVLQVTGAGAVNIDPTTGQDLTFTTLVAGDIVFNGVVIDSAGDLNMGTGDITNAGAITSTGFSGPLSGNVTGDVTGDVNSVTLTAGGAGGTLYLDDSGAYTAPPVGSGNSLQQAYVVGNTVAVTTAEGAVAMSNAADVTNVLELTRTFVGAGNALDVNMGPGNEAVTGDGINISSGTGATGDMLFVNNLGSGDALDVQDGGTTVLQVTGDGAVNIDPTTGEDLTFTTLVAGDIVLNGLSVSSAGDLDMGAGDITNAGAITSTGFSGPLTGDVTGDVNGVTLTTGGAATDFLNATGAYSVPAGTATLQTAYDLGNTVVATAARAITFSNAVDTADLLTLARTFAGTGDALDVTMATGTTGSGIHVHMNSAANVGAGVQVDSVAGFEGNGIQVSYLGTVGSALQVDNAVDAMLTIGGDGSIAIAGNSDGDVSLGSEGSGVVLVVSQGTGDATFGSIGGNVVITAVAGTTTVNGWSFPTQNDTWALPDTHGIAGSVLSDVAADGTLTFEIGSILARTASITGILAGGEITINGGDPNKYDVAAGVAQFADFTDPENPIVTRVSFNANIGVDPLNIATANLTRNSIDSNGDLQQINTEYTTADRRFEVLLQSVTHVGGNITSISLGQNPAWNVPQALLDYVLLLGAINTGNEVTAASLANLRVTKAPGTQSLPFINFTNDPNAPNDQTNLILDPADMIQSFIDSGEASGFNLSPITDVPVGFWDDGSNTLAATTQWVNYYFYFAGITLVCVIGQEVFAQQAQAEAARFPGPLKLEGIMDSTLRTVLTVKGNVTDLLNDGDVLFFQVTGPQAGGSSSVFSVFGRTGVISAADGDYTMQQVYAGSPNIIVDAQGPLALSNDTTVDDLQSLTRTFVGAGNALDVNMGPGNEAVTGDGINISSGTGATGDMLFVNNLGSGDALDVQDGGTTVLQVTGAGAVNIDPTTGQDLTFTTLVAGNIVLNGISVSSVGDLDMGAGDITNAGAITATGFSGPLTGDVNGVTLTTGGVATDFLNATGTYTVPASTATLQTAYDLGNTVVATAARAITFSNAVDLTDLLTLTRTFVGAGNALVIDMGPGNEAVTGIGLDISNGTGATGALVQIINEGSGSALDVQDGAGTSVFTINGDGSIEMQPPAGVGLSATIDGAAGSFEIDLSNTATFAIRDDGGGTPVLEVTGAGAVNIDPTTGQDLTFTTLVAGDIVLNGLSVSSAGDLDMGAGDITNAGAVTATSFSGPLTGDVTGDVNSVTLTAGGAGGTLYLDDSGAYTAPPGGGGGNSLQQAYVAGNTITVTTAEGAVAMSNAADVTNVLDLTRTFVGAGNALDVNMGPGNEAVTGDGINISSGTGATGDMLFVNNLGSGDALNVQDGGTTVLQVTGAGAVNIDPTTGQDLTFTTLVAGDIVLNGLSVSSAGDLDMGAGDITNAGAITSTGFSGPLTGAVNSVTLTAAGVATDYLDATGAYSVPAGTATLQSAYNAGRFINTDAFGAVVMTNSVNTATVLSTSRTFAGAGNAVEINMGLGGEATTGAALRVQSGSNAIGVMLRIDNLGSGDALDIRDGGTTVLQMTGAGAVNIDPTTGEDLTFTTLVAGDIVFNGVVIDSAGDLNMGAGDITNAGAVTATSFSGPVNGVTLTTGGVATDFLNATGAYTAPAGTATLQTAYDLGNTVVATAARAIAFSNAVDLTDLMTLTRTFVGAGNALDVNMGPGNEAVTGDGINITSGTGATGNMLFVNNLGSGDALNVQDGGATVLQVTGDGAVNIDPTTGQDLTFTTLVAGDIVFNGVVIDSSGGLNMATGDITNAKTVTFNTDAQTTSGTTLALDFSAAQKHVVTMASTITTVTITDPVGGGNFSVWIRQNGTGSFTLIGWPANVFWLNGTAPVFGDAANTRRLVSFTYDEINDEYLGEFNSGTYS